MWLNAWNTYWYWSERYSFSAVGSTPPPQRMQIASTLLALSKAPTVPLFSVLPVKFPAKEPPWWFLCWIHGGTYYWHRLWVSWGSSLISWEEGLNTTTYCMYIIPRKHFFITLSWCSRLLILIYVFAYFEAFFPRCVSDSDNCMELFTIIPSL